MIKSRDFVNLRCWHLCRNGLIVESAEVEPASSPVPSKTSLQSSSSSDSNHLFSDAQNGDPIPNLVVNAPTATRLNKSLSNTCLDMHHVEKPIVSSSGLSQSVGASGFYESKHNDEGDIRCTGNIYVSSARSIEYSKAPEANHYTR